jgi:PhnB protein
MATKGQAIPKGYHSVTPSLVVADGAKAIEFYRKAFGAQEIHRFAAPDGSIMHAVVQIGDSMIMLGDEMEGPGGRSPKSIGGTSVNLYIYQDNVDALWKRAVDAGAKVVQPLADQFWGDRGGCVEDPSGHQWWLAQHVKDLSDAELKEAAEAFFASHR